MSMAALMQVQIFNPRLRHRIIHLVYLNPQLDCTAKLLPIVVKWV